MEMDIYREVRHAAPHGNGQNAEKLKKRTNYYSRLLTEQKLMKLDRNNIHI
jgi:hypothetical protein